MTEEVLYHALQNLGMLHIDRNDFDAAAQALESTAEINDRHAEGHKRTLEKLATASDQDRSVAIILYHQNKRDRMLNFQRLGRVREARKDPEKAAAAYERALQIAQFFLETYPRSELAATDIASCSSLLGDVRFATADVAIHPAKCPTNSCNSPAISPAAALITV